MEVEYSSSDIISNLPQDIIENILIDLPIQDALRTSILSRKWRYCWTSIPKLLFDDKRFKVTSCSTQIMKLKFVNAIFHVLMLRTSPLVVFSLSFSRGIEFEINQIILYLSRMNTLKSFTLLNLSVNRIKLPCSFFSLQGLESLEISWCNFQPPPTFNGFSRLRWLSFQSVKITAKMLKRFLTNCPVLKIFYLVGQLKDLTSENKFTFVEFFECLPSIEMVAISKDYMKYFARGGMPHKLPTSLVHLRILVLNVCFMEQYELSSTLCLINSSPNLKYILLKLRPQPTCMNSLDLQDYSGFKFNHLDFLEMVSFSNLAIEKEFVKLIMTNSCVLNKVRLEIGDDISVDEELRIRRDYIRLPFSRASASTKLNVERPSKFIGEIAKVLRLIN